MDTRARSDSASEIGEKRLNGVNVLVGGSWRGESEHRVGEIAKNQFVCPLWWDEGREESDDDEILLKFAGFLVIRPLIDADLNRRPAGQSMEEV